MRHALTAFVWFLSIASLALGGLVTTEFIFMATSIDPGDLLAAGAEPWTNAMTAAAALTGLVLMTGFSLFLWHTRRFKIVGLALTMCEISCVGWACAKVYTEYF